MQIVRCDAQNIITYLIQKPARESLGPNPKNSNNYIMLKFNSWMSPDVKDFKKILNNH